MYCMKCGRDTMDDHVFCDICLQNMERHPVAPGTAVHLPNRSAAVKRPVSRKRSVPLEEQLHNLRRSLRRTRTFALILLVILAMTAVFLFHEITALDAPIIGQNYTIDINGSD